MDKSHFPAGSMHNVYLMNGFEVVPGAYGGTVKYENITGLVAAILQAVLLKPSRLSGAARLKPYPGSWAATVPEGCGTSTPVELDPAS